MNLTESQTKAILELGGMIEEHNYIPQRVLDQLLACGLIYWRTADDAELTPEGQEVYAELAGSQGSGAGASADSGK